MLGISRWVVATLLLLSSFWFFLVPPSKNGVSASEIQERCSNLEKSLAECRKTFKSAPIEAMININTVIVQYKAYGRGIEEFQRILDENPDDERILVFAHYSLASYYLAKGDYSKAIDKSNYIIENYPDSDEAFFSRLNIAYCYEKQSQWRKSEDIYKGIAEEIETDIAKESELGKNKDRSKTAWLGIVYQRLGKSLFRQERYEEARELFEKGLGKLEGVKEAFGPMAYQSSAEAQFLIGESYAKLGNNTGAQDAYRKVVKEYSNYEDYLGTKEWIDKAKARLNMLN